MIDRETGDLIIPEIPVRLGRNLTLDEIRRPPLAAILQSVSERGKYARAYLCLQDSEGESWAIQVYFQNGLLDDIHMMNVDPQFGTSWSDWSEQKEILRKQRHEECLRRWLGSPPYSCPWGTVHSVCDSKGGHSWIIVNYAKSAQAI